MGAEKQAKGRGGRRQRGQAPLQAPQRQGKQATKIAKPPFGHLHGRFCKCRRRSNAGDARGEAPCIRKQKISPFPAGEGGRGDRGQKES